MRHLLKMALMKLSGLLMGKTNMKITKPEMIIFDYGQTLADESSFDEIAGTEAILKYAVKNKYNLTKVKKIIM